MISLEYFKANLLRGRDLMGTGGSSFHRSEIKEIWVMTKNSVVSSIPDMARVYR